MDIDKCVESMTDRLIDEIYELPHADLDEECDTDWGKGGELAYESWEDRQVDLDLEY